MATCSCGKPATQRCAERCGYLSCDFCAKTMHQCGMAWVEAKVKQFVSSGRMIGRGRSGEAYVNDAMDKNILIKVSRDGNVCGNLLFEFEMRQYIDQVARQMQFSDPNVEAVRMYNHLIDVKFDGPKMRTRCALVMQRIHQPQMKGTDNPYAYQVELGRVSESALMVPYYGNIVGPSTMRSMTSDATMMAYANSLGRFLAFMHYAVKLDGNGVKYIIGHTLDNPKLKIFAINFGNVRQIDSYDSESAKAFAWSLRRYETFPRRGELYNAFKDGYTKTAWLYDQSEFAMNLLDNYEKMS